MNSFPSTNSLSVSVRVYRALLVAYPQKFREHYETQLVQVFRDSFREAYHRHGMSGVIDLWLHTFADLLITALIERITERSQYMLSPKIIFWGGLAAAFGGLVWLIMPFQTESGNFLLPLGLLLSLGGLTALHAKQAKQAGMLGWAGLILGIVGTGVVLWIQVLGIVSGDADNARNAAFAEPIALQFALGMTILGMGCILLGLRTLQTRVLPRWHMLPLALGTLEVAWGVSMWLVYYTALIQGNEPWQFATVPAIIVVLLTFPIGILWLTLGAILAENSGRQISNHPPASA